jgi:ABC-2 type transport system ATP-binding protein
VLSAKLRHLKNQGCIADDLLARFLAHRGSAARAGDLLGRHAPPLDIAMSLIGNPPIIFLDEPTPDSTRRPASSVADRQELADGGTTVLLTTHTSTGRAARDRIAILHKGTIIQNGTLTEAQASSSRPPRSSTSRSSPRSRTSSSPSSVTPARPDPGETDNTADDRTDITVPARKES